MLFRLIYVSFLTHVIGIRFLRETISKLEGENAEHMPIGFEVAFPSLLEIARSLNIEVVPDDSQVLQDIYAKRNIKLTRYFHNSTSAMIMFAFTTLQIIFFIWGNLSSLLKSFLSTGTCWLLSFTSIYRY